MAIAYRSAEWWFHQDIRKSLVERGFAQVHALQAMAMPEAVKLTAAGFAQMHQPDHVADKIEGIWKLRNNGSGSPPSGQPSPVL